MKPNKDRRDTDRQPEEGVSASGKKTHYIPNILVLAGEQVSINGSLTN